MEAKLGKTRLNITVDTDLKAQMELIKDIYGGFSGLIEMAVVRFLNEPVVPYEDDIKAYETSLSCSDTVDIDDVDWNAVE